MSKGEFQNKEMHEESSAPAYRSLENGELCPIFIKIPPENIVLFKFLVEAYDEIGIGRTLNPERGELVFLTLRDTVGDALKLLENVAQELSLQIIPPPESVKGDWLLEEYVAELRPETDR